MANHSVVVSLIVITFLILHHSLERDAFVFAGKRSSLRGHSKPTSTRARAPAWIEPLKTKAKLSNPSTQKGTNVLPVIPLHKIAWPGTKVQLPIVHPRYVHMYDDMLLSGANHIVATVSCLPEDEAFCGPKDQMLADFGTLLKLDRLVPVGEETDGGVKQVAMHTVIGRVRLNRLLNPAALYNFNGDDYLQAEVEILPEDDAVVGSEVDNDINIINAFEDLRVVTQHLGEPRPATKSVITEHIARLSPGPLAEMWQDWCLQRFEHREKDRAFLNMKSWFDKQRHQGRSLSEASEIVPDDLRNHYSKVHVSEQFDLRIDFWAPLLDILATDDVEERKRLIFNMAEEEVKLSTARKSLKDVVGSR